MHVTAGTALEVIAKATEATRGLAEDIGTTLKSPTGIASTMREEGRRALMQRAHDAWDLVREACEFVEGAGYPTYSAMLPSSERGLLATVDRSLRGLDEGDSVAQARAGLELLATSARRIANSSEWTLHAAEPLLATRTALVDARAAVDRIVSTDGGTSYEDAKMIREAMKRVEDEEFATKYLELSGIFVDVPEQIRTMLDMAINTSHRHAAKPHEMRNVAWTAMRPVLDRARDEIDDVVMQQLGPRLGSGLPPGARALPDMEFTLPDWAT